MLLRFYLLALFLVILKNHNDRSGRTREGDGHKLIQSLC